MAKTTLYMNNDEIQIVKKKGRRYTYDSVALKEGTVLNGAILNKIELVKSLKLQRKKLGKVTLVIDSSEVLVKKMQIPKLSNKKVLEAIKREFNLGNDNKYSYDFNVLSKGKKGSHILAFAVPKALLEKHSSVLKEACVKVLRIDVAMNGMIKYIDQISALKNQTFLMNVIVKDKILSLLFVDGSYQLSHRSNILNESGTEAYIAELYSHLSTVMQYGESQELSIPITQSYYTGIDSRVMRKFVQYMRKNQSKVTVEAYNDMGKDMKYIHPLMGHLLNQEDVDFKSTKKSKAKKGRWGVFLKCLILVAVIALTGAYAQQLEVQNAQSQSEIEALQTYMTAREEANSNSDDILLDNNQVMSEIEQYTWVMENISESKHLTPEMLQEIYGGEVTIESLNYVASEGTLIMGDYGGSQDELIEYSTDLRDSGYFDEVYYNGYRMDSTEEESVYYFSVNAVWNVAESEELIDDEKE